jgi:predicted nucleic acid-binding protein
LLILDSSFLVAFHNKQDAHHSAADRVMEELLEGRFGQALLLEYVFLEVVTVLLARRGLAVATSVAHALLNAREVEFVPCSDLFGDVFETFSSQKKASLSFTDAAIVTLAKRQNGASIATFDKDFRSIEGISVVP